MDFGMTKTPLPKIPDPVDQDQFLTILSREDAVARFAGSKQNHVIGLVGILALQIVTLMKDSSTGGLGALALSVPVAAAFYGIGLYVQSRSEKPTATPTVDAERVHA